MKTYICPFLFIICGFFFSCNEELEPVNDGRITLEEVFSDYNHTKGYLNACYYNALPKPHINRASYTDEAHDADDYVAGSVYDSWYSGNISSANYSSISSDSNPWILLYLGIRRCNVFIEYIKTSTFPVSETEKQSWIAQAHTLRALYYLQLIKRYGGVPIVKEAYEIGRDFSNDKKASFSEVVEFILEDCDKALAAPEALDGFKWFINDPKDEKMMTRAVSQAIRSQAITYAASPLWSDGTYTWDDATRINAEALSECFAHDYKLFDEGPAADVAQNSYALYFITNDFQHIRDKETIFFGGDQMSIWKNAGLPSTANMDKTGPCPTQNLIDNYEMINGEAPIIGYSDNEKLVPIINVNSGYNPKDPYSGRDPRFYASIYYNGAPIALNTTEAGLKFSSTDAFTSVGVNCPTWGSGTEKVTFSLYKWNVSYANSVIRSPIARSTFTNFVENTYLTITFDEQPAGEYLWVLSDGTEKAGVWKLLDATGTSTSFYKGSVTEGIYKGNILYSGQSDYTNLWDGSDHLPVNVIGGTKVEAYIGGKDGISATSRTHTRTGYYLRKYNNYQSSESNNADGYLRLFRLAEIYLNFAESAYQSDGPDAVISHAGLSMSARDAVNTVRARVGMPPFPYGMSKEDFKQKYRNERRIELAFEEHRFFDVRRWKILDTTDKYITGMRATPDGSDSYIFERFRLKKRASYTDKYLTYPIDIWEVNRVLNATGENWQNPGW